jgi:hypothetical protein
VVGNALLSGILHAALRICSNAMACIAKHLANSSKLGRIWNSGWAAARYERQGSAARCARRRVAGAVCHLFGTALAAD